jgi:hypothetical protein
VREGACNFSESTERSRNSRCLKSRNARPLLGPKPEQASKGKLWTPTPARDWLAIADPAQILAPSRLLGVTNKVATRNMVVMPKFAAAQAREVGFSAISAGAIDVVALLMVDPLHDEVGVQRVPGGAFASMNRGALGDPPKDRRGSIRFGRKYLSQRTPAALAHRNDNLAFARLIVDQPPVDPVGGQVLWPEMAAEVGTVDLGRASLATDAQRRVLADAMASRSLWAKTNAVLYCTSRSRQNASMLLPFTSLQKTPRWPSGRP